MQKDYLVKRAERWIEPLLTDLKNIVNIDSGTYTKVGVDQVGLYLQRRFREMGFATYFEPQQDYGNHLVATRKGQIATGPRILLIGHMDTVFPAEETQRRPFSIHEQDGQQIAKGPGVLDMKSGLLLGMYSIQLLNEVDHYQYQSITFICNSDEEVGSLSSRPLIQELARQADAVIVLEPGRVINRVVSSRKGVGNYRVEVKGVAAHAGVDPEHGRNAILELAHKIIALQAINGTIPGVTLNVGIIHGGERTNIVPETAYCEIDVRVASIQGLKAVEAALYAVVSQTTIAGTKSILTGGIRCMPFEKKDESAWLVQLLVEAGRDLELEMEDVASGGASDANNTASLGIPTIDGLGATGGLAHNPDEYIELASLPIRLALIVGLLERIGNYYQNGKVS